METYGKKSFGPMNNFSKSDSKINYIKPPDVPDKVEGPVNTRPSTLSAPNRVPDRKLLDQNARF